MTIPTEANAETLLLKGVKFGVKSSVSETLGGERMSIVDKFDRNAIIMKGVTFKWGNKIN